MIGKLRLTNSLTRKKELFEPINAPNVGMYVCGPTVYSDVHLGNIRTFISFDIINRYLKFLGYKVRYVRNITDVGHLLDTGEDKISEKARLDKLEPMEIVQKYTNDFHDVMKTFNALAPDIEPSAIGHLLEQIEMIETLLEKGFAYQANGSVYFDLNKYNESHEYGKLSGRKIEDLINQSRVLDGQEDKKNPLDFALWKKAAPNHIMRWKTKWSDGFPGWHLECSVMSTKYLGSQFDIHGGGMDLKFPHHECEIAQAESVYKKSPVNYWLHANMLTLNGKKMAKSTGNNILPDQMFSGENKVFKKAFSPMVVRFFMLQAHYRSIVDISEIALEASEKGFNRLVEGIKTLDNLVASSITSEFDLKAWKEKCYGAMNDDFNSPILIGYLFDAVKYINATANNKQEISTKDLEELKQIMNEFFNDVLGLKSDEKSIKLSENIKLQGTLDLLSEIRDKARNSKDFETSDLIRDALAKLNIQINDAPKGSSFKIK